jgi:hypothetical protein
MTLDQFLDRLREEAPKHRWWLADNRIRSECGCPLETVAGTGPGSMWLGWASERIGIGLALESQIASAADRRRPYSWEPGGYLMGNHTRLRHEMLRICGLA